MYLTVTIFTGMLFCFNIAQTQDTKIVKPGACPTAVRELYPVNECDKDSDCPGVSRCCFIAFGKACLIPAGVLPPSPEPCGPVEIWHPCASTCPKLCSVNPQLESYYANYLVFTGCDNENVLCRPGCTCALGYVRQLGHGGSFLCIPESKCLPQPSLEANVPVEDKFGVKSFQARFSSKTEIINTDENRLAAFTHYDETINDNFFAKNVTNFTNQTAGQVFNGSLVENDTSVLDYYY